MAKAQTENIPDSHLSYGKKRAHEIKACALTKFGTNFIIVMPNRKEQRFDVYVKPAASIQDKDEFEKQWEMCKVLTVIE